METLKQLYSIHSPSKREKKMRKFIRKAIYGIGDNISMHTDSVGNLYVKRGEADTYPCIVAHMDQVQDMHEKDFTVLRCKNVLLGYSPSAGAQRGLGADDKNGIWVAMQCIKRYPVIKAAFFVGEEIGCVGSSSAEMDFFSDCRFVLQCDRRGSSDLITNAGGVELCSDGFVEAIRPELFGYHQTHGLTTDVMQLKENGLNVSAVNISCGYYEPHTDAEYTRIDELDNCLAFVEHIIESCTDVYPHEFNYRDMYGGYYGGYYSPSSSKGKTLDELHDLYEMAYQDFYYTMMNNSSASFEEMAKQYIAEGCDYMLLYEIYEDVRYELHQQDLFDEDEFATTTNK